MNNMVATNPNIDIMAKIQRARKIINSKPKRNIKCPYCQHTALIVYADTTGYVETKCKKCKQHVLIDLVNMRRMNKK